MVWVGRYYKKEREFASNQTNLFRIDDAVDPQRKYYPAQRNVCFRGELSVVGGRPEKKF